MLAGNSSRVVSQIVSFKRRRWEIVPPFCGKDMSQMHVVFGERGLLPVRKRLKSGPSSALVAKDKN